MTSPYWLKLWIEIIDDPKVIRMPDWLFRRFILILACAKEFDKEGLLPPVEDIALRIRLTEKSVADALSALSQIGVARETAEGWLLINFTKRQDREYSDNPDAIRQRRHREKKRDMSRDTSVSVSTSISSSDSISDSDSLTHNIFKIYEQNIGIVPQSLIDELKDAEATYLWNWIERAFQIAAENNARKWSYIRAILKRWEHDGFDDRRNGKNRKLTKDAQRVTPEGRAKYGSWDTN